jgi:hypothetical protein
MGWTMPALGQKTHYIREEETSRADPYDKKADEDPS